MRPKLKQQKQTHFEVDEVVPISYGFGTLHIVAYGLFYAVALPLLQHADFTGMVPRNWSPEMPAK